MGALSSASADYSVGIGFSTSAQGIGSVSLGYSASSAGDYSLAIGDLAFSQFQGSFVWSDSTGSGNQDSGNDQFVATASGGFYFISGGAPIDFDSTITVNGINYPSDRNLKTNVVPLVGSNVLSSIRGMQISSWSYLPTSRTNHSGRVYNNPGDRHTHYGPMAQDWSAAFGGPSTNLNVGDEIGILLAAVKELDARVRVLEARLATNH